MTRRKRIELGTLTALVAVVVLNNIRFIVAISTQLIVVSALIGSYFVIQSLRNHYQAIREYRIRHNLCAKCEYDLRGISSGRCPECGERVIRQPSNAVSL